MPTGYPGPYLENKGNHQTQQKILLLKRKGPFFLSYVFLNEKTAFSLQFKKSSSKKWNPTLTR